ncbi:LEA type 2 family protein [bacterium]|nr:LEA type 2 family protein [bacterium]
MKKNILIFLFICLFIGSCATMRQLVQEPSVQFDSMELADFSFDDITALFTFNVNNPNAIGIKLSGYDYILAVNDKQFLQGTQNLPVTVPAKGTGKVTIPVTVKFAELYKMYQSTRSADEFSYNVVGNVLVNAAISTLKIPFSTSGKLPTVNMPKISLKDIRVNKLSFSGIDLGVVVNIDNPNILGFTLQEFDYNLTLAGKKVANGQNKNAITIPKKGIGTLNVPIKLNFSSLGSVITKAIRQGEIDYVLKGNAALKTEFGQGRLPFNTKGVTKLHN